MSKKTPSASERAELAAPAVQPETQLLLLQSNFAGYITGSVLRVTPEQAALILQTPDRAISATQEQADRAAPSYFFDLVPPFTGVEEDGASEAASVSDEAAQQAAEEIAQFEREAIERAAGERADLDAVTFGTSREMPAAPPLEVAIEVEQPNETPAQS